MTVWKRGWKALCTRRPQARKDRGSSVKCDSCPRHVGMSETASTSASTSNPIHNRIFITYALPISICEAWSIVSSSTTTLAVLSVLMRSPFSMSSHRTRSILLKPVPPPHPTAPQPPMPSEIMQEVIEIRSKEFPRQDTSIEEVVHMHFPPPLPKTSARCKIPLCHS